MGVVLLNVVFGIIIDSFADLRGSELARKTDMASRCFICGLDRLTLDTKGGGFLHHVDGPHNMWAYLKLIVSLRVKDPNDYNGWEQYVAQSLTQKPPPFLPFNSCMAMQELEEEEEEASRTMRQFQQGVHAKLNETVQVQRKLQQELQAIREQMATAEQPSLLLRQPSPLATRRWGDGAEGATTPREGDGAEGATAPREFLL